jgi:hypothetical protein
MNNIRELIALPLFLVWIVSGTWMFIVTLMYAYKASGLFAAIVSFFLPILSSIFWAFKQGLGGPWHGNIIKLFAITVISGIVASVISQD